MTEPIQLTVQQRVEKVNSAVDGLTLLEAIGLLDIISSSMKSNGRASAIRKYVSPDQLVDVV